MKSLEVNSGEVVVKELNRNLDASSAREYCEKLACYQEVHTVKLTLSWKIEAHRENRPDFFTSMKCQGHDTVNQNAA